MEVCNGFVYFYRLDHFEANTATKSCSHFFAWQINKQIDTNYILPWSFLLQKHTHMQQLSQSAREWDTHEDIRWA